MTSAFHLQCKSKPVVRHASHCCKLLHKVVTRLVLRWEHNQLHQRKPHRMLRQRWVYHRFRPADLLHRHRLHQQRTLQLRMASSHRVHIRYHRSNNGAALLPMGSTLPATTAPLAPAAVPGAGSTPTQFAPPSNDSQGLPALSNNRPVALPAVQPMAPAGSANSQPVPMMATPALSTVR